MLSILIPTYNYDASPLVCALHELGLREQVALEIIIGDDGSTTHTDWMEQATSMPDVRVVRPDHNVGRAAIRNLMAAEARGEWLLLVDCDAQVEADFSLSAYVRASAQADVVCGGLRHPTFNPNPEASLRYKYERAADRHRSAAERMTHPYKAFTAFNVLIRKNLFDEIGGFDADCKEYGYEDALFGVELTHREVRLLHIDNPLVHIGLDSNVEYLLKTETALRTLKSLDGKMDGWSNIMNWAKRIQRLHLQPVISAIYRWTRPLLRRNLLSHHPSLLLFQFYKLGYFLNLS